MGKKTTDIVNVDIKMLIEQLNKALADEWLAYYQYWIGARVASGLLRGELVAELLEHAADELKHAEMLAERILQLGGTPLTNPKKFSDLSNCGYLEPTDPKTKAIIKQGIEGERCAIEVYNKLLALTKDKDIVTYDMLLAILKDEIAHETDFMTLLEDLG